MVMGGLFSKGGSREVAKPIAIARLRMEDVCILYNVIEIFLQKKMTKVER
jgi:hypothetical protein